MTAFYILTTVAVVFILGWVCYFTMGIVPELMYALIKERLYIAVYLERMNYSIKSNNLDALIIVPLQGTPYTLRISPWNFELLSKNPHHVILTNIDWGKELTSRTKFLIGLRLWLALKKNVSLNLEKDIKKKVNKKLRKEAKTWI